MSTSGITYELALALKNAGFPQDGNGFWYVEMDSPAGGTFFGLSNTPHPKLPAYDGYDSLYSPTLSELIEACGDRFEKLSVSKGGLWIAEATIPICDEWYTTGQSKSPEEAVCALWLALNKK